MSARSYRACPTCRHRMKRLGTGDETIGRPPTPIFSFYKCSVCPSYWTYNDELGGVTRGVPKRFLR